MRKKNIKVYYDDELLGEIAAYHSMTVWDALDLLGIDYNEIDAHGDPLWDLELFEIVF